MLISVMPGEGAVCPAMVRIRFGDFQFAQLQIDDAADFEHHDARALRFEGFYERTGAVSRERRDANDLAAATASGVCRPAQGARKGEINWSRCGRGEIRARQREQSLRALPRRSPASAWAGRCDVIPIDLHEDSPAVECDSVETVSL